MKIRQKSSFELSSALDLFAKYNKTTLTLWDHYVTQSDQKVLTTWLNSNISNETLIWDETLASSTVHHDHPGTFVYAFLKAGEGLAFINPHMLRLGFISKYTAHSISFSCLHPIWHLKSRVDLTKEFLKSSLDSNETRTFNQKFLGKLFTHLDSNFDLFNDEDKEEEMTEDIKVLKSHLRKLWNNEPYPSWVGILELNTPNSSLTFNPHLSYKVKWINFDLEKYILGLYTAVQWKNLMDEHIIREIEGEKS